MRHPDPDGFGSRAPRTLQDGGVVESTEVQDGGVVDENAEVYYEESVTQPDHGMQIPMDLGLNDFGP